MSRKGEARYGEGHRWWNDPTGGWGSGRWHRRGDIRTSKQCEGGTRDEERQRGVWGAREDGGGWGREGWGQGREGQGQGRERDGEDRRGTRARDKEDREEGGGTRRRGAREGWGEGDVRRDVGRRHPEGRGMPSHGWTWDSSLWVVKEAGRWRKRGEEMEMEEGGGRRQAEGGRERGERRHKEVWGGEREAQGR